MGCPFMEECVASALGGEPFKGSFGRWKIYIYTKFGAERIVMYNTALPHDGRFFAIEICDSNGWFHKGYVDEEGEFHEEDVEWSEDFMREIDKELK